MAFSTPTQRYFRGQGRVYLGERNATGGFDSLRFLGNCPELMLDTPQTYEDHKESYTGQNGIDLRILNQTQVNTTLTLENTVKENWAFAFKGSVSAQAGATVTGEEITAPTAGNYFALAKKVISSVTSITSDPTGTTFVAGTDYELALPSNLVRVPTGSALAGDPILVNYVAGSAEVITPFTQAEKELYLYFDGLNTVEGQNPVVVELFKVNFAAAAQISLISDSLTQMQLTGTTLFDPLNIAEGGYFKITQKTLA